jgi:hypothetical protein
MTAYSRQGNKWTINEILSLQREYELLELSVQQIAEKHQRSETSILYKLDSEGLIDSWNNARGFDSVKYQNNETSYNETKDQVGGYNDDDNDDNDDDNDDDDDNNNDDDYQFEENEDEYEDEDITDDESDVEKLTERVWSLETSVGEISSMVKNIFTLLTTKQSSKKRKPLRALSSSA